MQSGLLTKSEIANYDVKREQINKYQQSQLKSEKHSKHVKSNDGQKYKRNRQIVKSKGYKGQATLINSQPNQDHQTHYKNQNEQVTNSQGNSDQKYEQKGNILANYKQSAVNEREMFDKIVASLFISKGYGPQHVNTAARTIVPRVKYDNSVTSVIRYTLRQFCKIITTTFGKNMKTFDFSQQIILRPAIASYQKWFSPNEQQTIFKIVNIVYATNNLPIFQDQMMVLYDKLHEILQTRRQMVNDKRSRFSNQSVKSQNSRKRYRGKIKQQQMSQAASNYTKQQQSQANEPSMNINDSTINQNYSDNTAYNNYYESKIMQKGFQDEQNDQTNQIQQNELSLKNFAFLKRFKTT